MTDAEWMLVARALPGLTYLVIALVCGLSSATWRQAAKRSSVCMAVVIVIVLATVGSRHSDWAPFIGAVIGSMAGIVLVTLFVYGAKLSARKATRSLFSWAGSSAPTP